MTNESFYEWKRLFDIELQEKMDPVKQAEIAKRKGKLTGFLIGARGSTETLISVMRWMVCCSHSRRNVHT